MAALFSFARSTAARTPRSRPQSPHRHLDSKDTGGALRTTSQSTASGRPLKSSTPVPQVPHVPPPLYVCRPFVEAALVKGDFQKLVRLPKGIDDREWVALNMYDFYNNLNSFYGVVSEFCTPELCPTMAAGARLDYTWIDANRKPVKLAAPVYIDFVFTWGQHLLDDPTSFPTGAHDFPENYVLTCKHLYRQLLRVFAHIYHAHFEQLLHLCSEPHFNSLFAHFLSFGAEFEILDMRDLRGSSSAPTGIGQLYDAWTHKGIVRPVVGVDRVYV